MLFNNRFIKYFLLIISALSYAISFILPSYFFWLNFIFLIPIFYLVEKNKLCAFDGVLWTCFAFGLQAIGFFILFFERTPFLGALLLTGLIFLYFSCYTMFWFYSISLILRYNLIFFYRIFSKSMITIFTILSITLATTFYFYFFYYYILWPIGSFHGYVFSHPLLPFASYRALLYPIKIAGLWPTTMILIFFQYLLSNFFVTKKYLFIFFSFLIISPLAAGFIYSFIFHWENCDTSKIFQNISYIQPHPNTHTNPYICAKKISSQIEFLCKNKQESRIVLMPESTFPFDFQEDSRSAELIFDAIGDNTIFIFGGHRLDSAKKLYNSLFCCYGRRIIYNYDKSHLMPFTEFTITSTKFFSLLSTYSWPLKTEFVPRDHESSTLAKTSHVFMCKTHAGIISFIPIICSDLFLGTEQELFSRLKEKRCGQHIILCIANDSWFSIIYVRNLMRLYAHLVSQITNTSMIYVDHMGIKFFNAV